ncbi:MAG: hypothetical protein J7M08_04010 [Planctomycetes bacterium]|nr:hypothetical protein [Planctomycetota bacterium]
MAVEDAKEMMTETERLELIKQRHQKLILGPREMIAIQMADEADDPFDQTLDLDEIDASNAPRTAPD